MTPFTYLVITHLVKHRPIRLRIVMPTFYHVSYHNTCVMIHDGVVLQMMGQDVASAQSPVKKALTTSTPVTLM